MINPDTTGLLCDAIAAGASQSCMQTFDQSLYDLLQEDLITYEEALAGATHPREFKLRAEGIRSSEDISSEEASQVNAAFREVKRFGYR